MLLPAPLRPENGTVNCGDDKAGWMYTRGHKYSQNEPCQDSEDYIACMMTDKCTVGGVFDGHGGTACARACAEIMMPQFASKHSTLTHVTSCVLLLYLFVLSGSVGCLIVPRIQAVVVPAWFTWSVQLCHRRRLGLTAV